MILEAVKFCQIWLIIAAPVIRFSFTWSLIGVCWCVFVCVAVCRCVSARPVYRNWTDCSVMFWASYVLSDVGSIQPSSAFLSYLFQPKLIVDVWIQLPNKPTESLFLCWFKTLTSCQFQVSSHTDNLTGVSLKCRQSVIKLLLVSRWLFVVDLRTELSFWLLGFSGDFL